MMQPDSTQAGLGRLTLFGIKDPAEALLLSPIHYQSYQTPSPSIAAASQCPKECYLRLLITRAAVSEQGRQGRARLKLVASDGVEQLWITIFGHSSTWMQLRSGDEVHLVGRLTRWGQYWQITNPTRLKADEYGCICPIYPSKRTESGKILIGSSTIAQKIAYFLPRYIEQAIVSLLAAYQIDEATVLQQAHLQYSSLKAFFTVLHRPTSLQEGEAALNGMTRLNALYALTRSRQNQPIAASNTHPITIKKKAIIEMIERLPFQPTLGQCRTMYEIITDLASDRVMRRLLCGDVGCGKTVAYGLPAVLAAKAGLSVAIFVPNATLGRQILEEVQAFAPELLITSVFAEHQIVSAEALEGRLIVGTTALIHLLPKVDFTLDWLIVDEQQKIGNQQKQHILTPSTHLLEVSATPIPRSVAIMTQGHYTQSRLDECPVKKQIHSLLLQPQEKMRAAKLVAHVVAQSQKVAVLYPLVESDSAELNHSVIDAAEKWERLYPSKVVLIHGRMTPDEKMQAIEAIKRDDKQILVTTTIIEIGITIPSLQGMVVVDADRHGASSLHQFRGRLARQGGEGYFVMLPTKPTEQLSQKAVERLELLVSETNGFAIADFTLSQKGFGDLGMDSVAQSGFQVGYFIERKIKPEDLAEIT